MYKIGTCFGCKKCLYCGIDLRKNTCKCKKTVKPTRANRTELVKHAFPRVFNPTISNSNQFNFIKNKEESFQYGFDLTKSIQISFCSACNSAYQRLSSKSSDNSNKSKEGTENADIIVLDETISSKVSAIVSASSEVTQSESIDNNLEIEDDVSLELEINYKLLIKQADGITLPAKNYSVTISELDEFLFEIQKNIVMLLGDEEINANDYSVSFKSEKAQGVGTLLVDVCDFENFQSEYIKLTAAKKVVLILITMKKKEKPIAKRKKKVNLLFYYIFFIVF